MKGDVSSDPHFTPKAFSTSTSGKWIMLGAHSVLRGCPALVFPLESLRLHFEFSPSSENGDLELKLSGRHGHELDLLFWGVLEKACALTGLRRKQIQGVVSISNDIPVGAGLGASAAFCVAFARWFADQGLLPVERIEKFATELENLFHGESSGLDVAVAERAAPLRFLRGKGSEVLDIKWKPYIYLSYSGERGVTKDCIQKVSDLAATNPTLAVEIDQRMREAVSLAETALLGADLNTRYSTFQKAVELGASCFTDWGLFKTLAQKRAAWLKDHGATAVKPTGSGGGGYVLSLWPAPAPASLIESGEVIAAFVFEDSATLAQERKVEVSL